MPSSYISAELTIAAETKLEVAARELKAAEADATARLTEGFENPIYSPTSTLRTAADFCERT